ncbi:MAG TPA: GFA family protein [Steroidobacteraceae bacterium]|nr:GFA family protein [Steroidobacteraceae bacterium]
MTEPIHTGGCLCGAVRYQVTGPLRPVVLCHCSQCRRNTGHFMAATAAQHRDFRLRQEAELRWYLSSESARRGFCGRCGSTLFWQGAKRDYISIAAGTLDGATGLTSACHIFVADKGDYYSIDDGLPQSADGNFSVAIPRA